ncbi:winged helix-turn-helix transcriptional regulator [Aurantimonas sp. DM33-3]|uniref:MarR family winged helix-turn-helix transcriptional regulator n=1 Tax=Aurantimonas sp. DM33-3 TaxID=2766955 RepID=UPI001652116F|nr:MarR family winged helix-turn-helix transcriptional regulator [Aurantimonas sp. DM33-3]MBC6718763.1 winged helix-turn-helix transcriptional regulator [Aurantimonas sp. DM33-3]
MDDIANTAPPAATDHKIVEELLRVAKLTRAHVDIALRVADLHPGQDEMICVLTTKPIMTVSEIADLLNIRSSTVSKTTDRLVAKGLVKRVPVELDHRKTALVLTEAGVETQALVREIWRGVEENLFGDLSASEKDEIREGLELLDSRLRERVARFRRPLQQSTSENGLRFDP